MKTLKISLIALFVIVLSACGGNKTEDSNTQSESEYIALDKLNIDELEAEIKKRIGVIENDSVVNKGNGVALMEAFIAYGDNFSDNEKAADYLFRAGEIAMNLNHTAQSIKLFSRVYSDFKDYEKRPYALFMKAFVLENQALNYNEAKIYYDEFISEYPDHPMTDDAEYSVKNLGKTPEELIKEFETQDSLNALKEAA
jgi:tetratricopeptide (TPR) repeat protein